MSESPLRFTTGQEAKCEDVRLAMGEVLDGVADSVVQGVVEAHVRQCNPCAREMEELKEVVEGVKDLSDVKPPKDAFGRVEGAAGGAAKKDDEKKPGWFKRFLGG